MLSHAVGGWTVRPSEAKETDESREFVIEVCLWPTNADEVRAALALGAVSSVGLLIGVIAGAFSRIRHRRIAIAMSVGAGLLLAGVSLKVTADAIRLAGPIAVALSLLLGAAAFSASNALLARFGAAHRKRCGECIQQPAESQQPGSGIAIALGTVRAIVPAIPKAVATTVPLHAFSLVSRSEINVTLSFQQMSSRCHDCANDTWLTCCRTRCDRGQRSSPRAPSQTGSRHDAGRECALSLLSS